MYRVQPLVGSCLVTGNRISATGVTLSQTVFYDLCLSLPDFRGHNHGLKGPQKPKTCCGNKVFAILSFTSVFTVRSGAVWRQDLAILPPEGSRDSTFQLRFNIQILIRRLNKRRMHEHIAANKASACKREENSPTKTLCFKPKHLGLGFDTTP